MRTRVLARLVLVAVIICGGQVLGAEDFVKLPGQTFYLDFDTKEGHYSEWREDDLGAQTALRASVKNVSVKRDPQWRPAFWIFLLGSGAKQPSAGVQLIAQEGRPPLRLQVIQFGADRRVIEQYLLKNTLKLNEIVSVKADWSTPGIVTISLNDGAPFTLHIQWHPEHLAVGCTTGEIEVDPLILGMTKH